MCDELEKQLKEKFPFLTEINIKKSSSRNYYLMKIKEHEEQKKLLNDHTRDYLLDCEIIKLNQFIEEENNDINDHYLDKRSYINNYYLKDKSPIFIKSLIDYFEFLEYKVIYKNKWYNLFKGIVICW